MNWTPTARRSWPAALAVPILAVALLLVASCTTALRTKTPSQTAVPRQGPASSMTTGDQVDIYSLVVRRVCEKDDTFGGKLAKPIIYIVRATEDKTSDPSLLASESVMLPEAVQDGVTARLADLSSKIRWVDSFDDVPLDKVTGGVKGGGVVVKLGNISLLEANSARVPASIYVGNLGAGGRTYLLEKTDGAWKITGTTGTEWIS